MTKLLCTYTNESALIKTIVEIKSTYILTSGRIYVFSTEDEVICSYNIENCNYYLDNTLSVQRKKESNTLYTINALNELIKLENNGVYVQNFNLDWIKYKDNIITIKKKKLQIKELILVDIVITR